MGLVQKDAFRTMIISYLGVILGYLNKGLLFLIIFETEEIGLLSLILSMGLLFAQFANLGTVFTTWRFFPFFRNKEKRHHGFLPLMLIIAGLGSIFYSSLYFLLEDQIKSMYVERSPLFTYYYYWVLPIGIFYVLYLVLDVYLKSLYKNVVSVFALDIALRVSLTGFLFLKWFDVISFETFVAAHSLVYILPATILLVYLYYLKELNLSISSIDISSRFRKIIIQFSSFSYVNTMGMVLVNSLDVIMIAQFLGLKATGIYAIVIFLASALQVPYRSIIRVSSPMIADHWKHRQLDKMKELYVKVSGVSLFIGLTLFLVIWLNIDLIFSFLKPEYKEGIWVFFFLMIGRIFDMFAGLNGAIFVTSKKYKYEVFFTFFLIVSVFVLNLLFIPWWGIPGAAISTAMAMILYNVARLFFVWYMYKIHPFKTRHFVMISLAIATLFIGMYAGQFIANPWTQFLIEIGIGMITFIFPIYLFKLEPDSIDYAHKWARKINSKFKKSNY